MATVLNKPDALNLSGNLNKFILFSQTTITFVLRKGPAVLLQRSYEPDTTRKVVVDLKDVVESELSYTLNAGQAAYAQSTIVADFTATIDGTDCPFRVVRGGVSCLTDTAANWLKLHFLTWQPRVKEVTYYSPEWLTYYAVEACTVRLKATYPDKSSRTISLQSCTAGTATTFNLQYSVVAGKLGNTYPTYYEVWTETPGGAKLSESQIYAFSEVLSENEQWYLFENSLGGLDTFRAYGTNNLAAEHEHNIAEFGDVREEYQVDTERKYVKNTGHLDEYAQRWLLDFFPSKAKYVYEATAIRKIVVSESNATYVSNELPSSYTFTWQLAEVSPYLNLVKNAADIPDTLVAPDLSSPDFILPPRLAEFPRVQLTEGVLIPAFDPHSPKPTVTTFGAMHDTIKNAIVKELEDELANIGSGGGSGGGSDIYIIKTNDLTIETDENVYSAARAKAEHEQKLEDDENKYIRKDRTDETDFRVDFKDGITVGEYVGGFLGDGTILEPDGHIEATSLTLREFLEVPELRFNRIDVVSGELWNSIAFGLIESVDETNRIVKLKLEDGELSGLHVNDFCRGIFHNLMDNDTTPGTDSSGFDVMVGFRTSYFTPVEIIDNGVFRYELKPGSAVHPCQSMKFAVYGNPTDKNRQSSAYHTRNYTRYLRGVSTWKIEEKHISMQMGDLTNLIINGERLEEGSVYLNNVYFGGNVWYTKKQEEDMKGKDAYSVTLSTYSAVYNKKDGIYDQVDITTGDKLVVTGVSQVVASDFKISTRLQVSKGPEPLRYSEVIGEGKYVVSATGYGCKYVVTDGLLAVREVTEDKAEITLEVNCEGLAVYEAVFTVVRVMDGADGKGIEYIYRRTTTNSAPSTPATIQTDDHVPSGWTDDPVGPTLQIPYEWVSERTKKDNVWSDFSSPSLWVRYAEDGTDHEYIYRRTTTLSTPSTPSTSQNDDYVPAGWTDDAVGVNSTYIYEWRSERKKDKEVWSGFSVPALWAKYSFDGEPGRPGTDGTSEYTVYRRSTAQPSTPSGSSLPPSGWALDPPAGSTPLWGSKAVFYSNGSLSRNWSTPVKITGDPGEKGPIGSIGPAITNRGKYSSVKQYYGGADRVDVVYDGTYYYMAKTTAGTFQGQPLAIDNKYWTRLQGQFESVATGLAIIGEANIAGWRFKELYIESQNNNVVLDGNADDGPRIALGASYANRYIAPLRMYEDGRAVIQKGEIAGFNIENGWLKANATPSKDVGYIDMRSSNTRISFGTSVGNPYSTTKCTSFIENAQPNMGGGSGLFADENIALRLRSWSAGECTALDCVGGLRWIGRTMNVNQPIVVGGNAIRDVIEVKIRYCNEYVFGPSGDAAVDLPSASMISSAFGSYTLPAGGNTEDSSLIQINIMLTRWATGRVLLRGVSGAPLIDNNGTQITENSSYSYGNIYLGKGDHICVVYMNRSWYIRYISR